MLASNFCPTSKLVLLPHSTCVLIVQVHERTLQGDFLMALLRDLVISRRTAGNPLKVFLPRLAPLYLMRQAVLLCNLHCCSDCCYMSHSAVSVYDK